MKKFLSICAAASMLLVGTAETAISEVLQEKTFTFTIDTAPEEPAAEPYPNVVVSGIWRSLDPIPLPAGMSGIAFVTSTSVTTGPTIQTRSCTGTVAGEFPDQTCSAWSAWGSDASYPNTRALNVSQINQVRLLNLPPIAAGQSLTYVIKAQRLTSSPQIGSMTINRQGGYDDENLVSAFTVNVGENPVITLRNGLSSVALTSSATVSTGPSIQYRTCTGTVSGSWPNQTCGTWSGWSTDPSYPNTASLPRDRFGQIRLADNPNVPPGQTVTYTLKSSRSTSSAAVIGSVSYTGAASQPDMNYVVSGLWNALNPVQFPAGLNGIAFMDSASVTTGPSVQTRRCTGTLSGAYPDQTCSAWSAWATDPSYPNTSDFDGVSVYQARLADLPAVAEGQSRTFVLREYRSTSTSQIGSLTINREGGYDDENLVSAFTVNVGENPVITLRNGLSSVALTSSATVSTGPSIQYRTCTGTVSGSWPNQTCGAWSGWSTDPSYPNTASLPRDRFGQIRLADNPNVPPGQTVTYTLKSSRSTSSAAVIGSVSYTGAASQPDMNYVVSGLWSALNPVQFPAGLNGIAFMDSASVTTGPSVQTRRCTGTLSGAYPDQTCSAWSAWATDPSYPNTASLPRDRFGQIRLATAPTLSSGQTLTYVLKSARTTSTAAVIGSVSYTAP